MKEGALRSNEQSQAESMAGRDETPHLKSLTSCEWEGRGSGVWRARLLMSRLLILQLGESQRFRLPRSRSSHTAEGWKQRLRQAEDPQGNRANTIAPCLRRKGNEPSSWNDTGSFPLGLWVWSFRPAVCEFSTYYTASTFQPMGQMVRKGREWPPKLWVSQNNGAKQILLTSQWNPGSWCLRQRRDCVSFFPDVALWATNRTLVMLFTGVWILTIRSWLRWPFLVKQRGG